MKRVNKVWQEHEKYQLWVAYQVKTPLKVLEVFFNRTSSAINKYLSRSGIRETVKMSKFDRNKIGRIKTVAQLRELIVSCGIDSETVGLERRYTRSWKPSCMARSRLNALGVDVKAPWKVRDLEKKLPKKSGIGRSSKNYPAAYVSLETCCHYLIRHGIAVKRLNTRNPFKWVFLVGDQPVTDMGLLKETNLLRIEKNETKFHVEGLTCD